MKPNAHIKQYIKKITCWLGQRGFEPEVVQQVMRVVIPRRSGYTNPVLLFDKDKIRINLYHSLSISGSREQNKLLEQLEPLNIQDASYAYGIGLYDKLLYADLLPISGSNADTDNRLDEFCQRAFITAPQMLDNLIASTIETPV